MCYCLISEEKVNRQPEFVREVSIVDFLKGSDGQVYRGRYKVCLYLQLLVIHGGVKQTNDALVCRGYEIDIIG